MAPQERDGAIRELLETSTELDALGHACPPELIRTRIRAWDLGKFQLNVAEGPWLRFGLNRQVTTDAGYIAAQLSGQTTKSQGEQRHTFRPGDISIIHFSTPYQILAGEVAASMFFRFSYAELSLPAASIRPAVRGMAASPLYELFQTHLLELHRCLEDDVPVSAAESLGSATLELARAVIATVGQSDLARNDIANEALITRIEAYVQQHLADPELSPESIAHAHHISVRQLYKLWSDKNLGLAEWIIRGRLEGARHDLAKGRALGIGAVARRWGFTDPTHFGRRFRAAYGLSPTEWKQAQEHQEHSRAAAS
ncbi:MAG: helix-turn-helix domain-containing protein [Nocardiopsaceae bacterium]|nr:helix-turn-helix domain-containing protein [Nocardiopsaceae bacterium]